MVWWIDLAIVVVSLAGLAVVALSVWGAARRLLREIGQVRTQLPPAAGRSTGPS